MTPFHTPSFPPPPSLLPLHHMEDQKKAHEVTSTWKEHLRVRHEIHKMIGMPFANCSLCMAKG